MRVEDVRSAVFTVWALGRGDPGAVREPAAAGHVDREVDEVRGPAPRGAARGSVPGRTSPHADRAAGGLAHPLGDVRGVLEHEPALVRPPPQPALDLIRAGTPAERGGGMRIGLSNAHLVSAAP